MPLTYLFLRSGQWRQVYGSNAWLIIPQLTSNHLKERPQVGGNWVLQCTPFLQQDNINTPHPTSPGIDVSSIPVLKRTWGSQKPPYMDNKKMLWISLYCPMNLSQNQWKTWEDEEGGGDEVICQYMTIVLYGAGKEKTKPCIIVICFGF